MHIPNIAPRELKIMEEKEKASAPHKVGIYPPSVEPIIVPIKIKDLEFTFK